MVSAELHAQMYVVSAFSNSSSGGTAVSTVSLTAGQNFVVAASPTDLWSAGALPRWSNADGLVTNLFATGTDDSGASAGTQIGSVFPLWTQDGFTAPYGALVGRIGTDYLLLGTSFNGFATASGTLELFYWDSNFGDNSESIVATIRVGSVPVPEPSTYGIIAAGLLLAGAAWRRARGKKQ